MKKLFCIVLLFGSFFSQAQVKLTCKEQLQEKRVLRNAIGGIVTGTSALPAGSMLIGASAAAAPIILPIAIGTTAVGGVYWVISTTKPRRLVRLIDEAKSCGGRLINKAYKAYEKTHQENQRLTKSEFCSEVVRANKNGSLCASGKFPSVKSVGRYYID